jgi:hypothetical protein
VPLPKNRFRLAIIAGKFKYIFNASALQKTCAYAIISSALKKYILLGLSDGFHVVPLGFQWFLLVPLGYPWLFFLDSGR